MRFRERAAVVTGGGSGIGRSIASHLAVEGAAVLIADIRDDFAQESAKAISAAGGRALGFQADVRIAAEIDAMVSAAEEAFGQIDVLVNNAYACAGDDVASMDDTTWNSDLFGTLTSAFLCSKRVLGGMLERRHGVIVNVASVNGLTYFGNEAYSAAKAGMINLTQSIAVRYGPHGIRANAVAPGSIHTSAWGPSTIESLARWYPLGRVGHPDDVAKAVTFLASEDASWITGVVLRVDGGLLAGNGAMAGELLSPSPEL